MTTVTNRIRCVLLGHQYPEKYDLGILSKSLLLPILGPMVIPARACNRCGSVAITLESRPEGDLPRCGDPEIP